MLDSKEDYEFTAGNLKYYSRHVTAGVTWWCFNDRQTQTASSAEPTSEASEVIIIEQCILTKRLQMGFLLCYSQCEGKGELHN